MIADGHRPETLNDFEKSDYWRRLALRYIADHPGQFTAAYLRGVAHALLSTGTEPYARLLRLPRTPLNIKEYGGLRAMLRAYLTTKRAPELLLTAAAAAYLLVSYLCLAVGLFAACKRQDGASLVLPLVMAAYFVATAGAYGLARHKLPAVPFYLPFVGLGFMALRERLRPSAPR
jgi:hypothetical protein